MTDKQSNLSFELVSDPEIIRFTHLNAADTWANGLTAHEYSDREWNCTVVHNPRDHQTNLGLYHFVLRDLSIEDDGSDPKTYNIVASCETWNRKAWRVDPNGQTTEIIAPCIGAVYTLKNHRKKGYAGSLITKLNEYWDGILPNNGFIFLYSEVGDYYSRFDYESFEVPTHYIKVPKIINELSNNFSKFHYLNSSEYPAIVDKENALIQQRLEKKSKNGTQVLFSLSLDADIFEWFHRRDLFAGSRLRPGVSIDKYGASLDDGSGDFITWLHEWSDDGISIIYLKYSSIESLKTLVDIVFKEAQDNNLGYIKFWDSTLKNPDDDQLYAKVFSYLKSFDGTKTFKSNSSISAIRVNKPDQSSFSWENNDKWCWF